MLNPALFVTSDGEWDFGLHDVFKSGNDDIKLALIICHVKEHVTTHKALLGWKGDTFLNILQKKSRVQPPNQHDATPSKDTIPRQSGAPHRALTDGHIRQ